MKINKSSSDCQEVVPSSCNKRPYTLRTRVLPNNYFSPVNTSSVCGNFFETITVQPCPIPENFRLPYAIWPENKRIQKIIQNTVTTSLAENQWIKSIDDFQNVMSIKHIPDSFVLQEFESNLGKGVFVNLNSSRINKNEFIGIYSGVVRIMPENQRGGLYAFSVSDDIVVDAQVEGNFTRFINHGQAKHANVSPQLMQTAHHNAQIVLIATKRIQPGCQILMNYGPSYWRDQQIVPFTLTPQSIQIVPGEELAPLAKKQK